MATEDHTIARLREALRSVLTLTRGPVNGAEVEILKRAAELCEPRSGEAKEGAHHSSRDMPIAFRREYRSTSRPRPRRGP